MRKVISYLLSFINFGLFFITFIVTRDLFQKLLALIHGISINRGGRAWYTGNVLYVVDLVLIFVLGIILLIGIILIQSWYEKTKTASELGFRFAFATGLQLTWIGLSRLLWALIPIGQSYSLMTTYSIFPIVVGLVAVTIFLIFTKRRLNHNSKHL